jgi:hypothetical protein
LRPEKTSDQEDMLVFFWGSRAASFFSRKLITASAREADPSSNRKRRWAPSSIFMAVLNRKQEQAVTTNNVGQEVSFILLSSFDSSIEQVLAVRRFDNIMISDKVVNHKLILPPNIVRRKNHMGTGTKKATC